MTLKFILISIFTLLQIISCNTSKLKIIAKADPQLKELSALEIITHSDLLWSIEDAGNDPIIYGLNRAGAIIKKIKLPEIKNRDWEDLTTDHKGNLYIGDFGNNKKKHKHYYIYKVSNLGNISPKVETMSFKLPKKMTSKDFEAFFLWKDYFYIFSKDPQEGTLIKVPNRMGEHTAKLVTVFQLKGKRVQITASDISENGKKIALLNHDKIILLSNFTSDNFFEGHIKYLEFDHHSQKEGLCFKNNHTVMITDEYKDSKGGNIYEFNL